MRIRHLIVLLTPVLLLWVAPEPAAAQVCGDAGSCSSAAACDGLVPGSVCSDTGSCRVVKTTTSFFGTQSICCGCSPATAGLWLRGNRAFTGKKLRELVDENIPTTNSKETLIVLTQCYGGDVRINFEGRTDTTVISATSPGQLAVYGGYDDDAAGLLYAAPGRTSDDVHAAGVAGKDDSEVPTKRGPGASLEPTNPAGPIKSRHILVYAGDPNDNDRAQRDTIKTNNGTDPATTVTTVGGAGVLDGWDYPGTIAGLVGALAYIKALMNPDEQFILFVTDHGTYIAIDYTPTCGAGSCSSASLSVPEEEALAAFLDDQNQPSVCAFSPGPNLPDPVDFTIFEGGSPVFNVPAVPWQPFPLNDDPDLLDPGEGFQACGPIDENLLFVPALQVQVQALGPNPLVLSEISIDNGGIIKLGGAPGVPALGPRWVALLAACLLAAALLAARRDLRA